MASNMPVRTYKVFNGLAITQDNAKYSEGFNVTGYIGSTVGKIAFFYEITETGATDLNIDYQVSVDGKNWVDPVGSAAIFDAIDANSTTTRGFAEKDLEFAPWYRFKATEQNVSEITDFNLWMVVG